MNAQKRILTFVFFSIFSSFFFLQKASSQTPTLRGKTTSAISYPVTIPDVGTCNSWAECRNLCDDPINKPLCYSWAVQSNIIKPKNEDAVKKAMQELSCSSKETCAAYCANPQNKQKCLAIGQKYNLLPDYEKRIKTVVSTLSAGAIAQNVKQAIKEKFNTLKIEVENLALDNKIPKENIADKLIELCEKPENAQRCKKIADALGEESSATPGPGGCKNPVSCRRYCDNPDNFSECSAFGMTGPHGCRSSLSCYQVCQKGGCTNTTRSLVFAIDPTKPNPEILQSIETTVKYCEAELDHNLAEATVIDTIEKLKRSGICELYDANNPQQSKQQRCSEYLDENMEKPLNKQEFLQYCVPLPVIPIKKTITPSLLSEKSLVENLDATCSLLENLGKTHPSYIAMASSCKSFTETIKSARAECNQQNQTKETITDTEENIKKYCLSAPIDQSAYQKACQQNASSCKEGGYDWYCKQNPTQCAPIIEGESFLGLPKRFTYGINAMKAIQVLNKSRIEQEEKTITGDKEKTNKERKQFFSQIEKKMSNTTEQKDYSDWDISVESNLQKTVPLRWSNIPFVLPPSPTPMPNYTPPPGMIKPTLPYNPTILLPLSTPSLHSPQQNNKNPRAIPNETTMNEPETIQNKFIPLSPQPLQQNNQFISPNTPTPIPTTSAQQSTIKTPQTINTAPSPTVRGASDTAPLWQRIINTLFRSQQ